MDTIGGDRSRRILLTGVGGSIGTAIINSLEGAGNNLIKVGQAGMAEGDINVEFRDDDALAAVIDGIAAPLDGIVLAHGALQPGSLSETTPAAWRGLLDVNLNSLYVILHTAASKLRKGASIVVISSTAAFDHSPVGGPHYTVSKWAVNGLVRHLAGELGPLGIRINSVCPGWVDNPMGRSFMTEQELVSGLAAIPLRRPAKPEEIASVVKFLLSDDASYMSGALVPVSGGYR